MRKFKCSICGYVYDEAAGIPAKGIAPGTKWEDISAGFACPVCGAPKAAFQPFGEAAPTAPAVSATQSGAHAEALRELSAGELSAICSSLAKGCEKQRLAAEAEAFATLADYFHAKAAPEAEKGPEDEAALLEADLSNLFPAANAAAKAEGDRGALRSLVWAEKVSAMGKMLLDRYAKEGDAMLRNAKIFVCDICGFIYIGDAPPEICPVCKVPSFRILEIEA